MKIPSPPKHLSKEARRWYRAIANGYAIEDEAGILLLQTAMESFDRMRRAQAEIEDQGQLVKDRFGQLRSHPSLAVERDARQQMLAALKQLNLDLEPLRDGPGRPPGK